MKLLSWLSKYKAYIISAMIGSVITLIIYPIERFIDFSYWQKQEKYQKYVRLYDRKINLIDEFNTTLNLYLLCSWKTSANIASDNYKPENLSCYWNSKAKLNSLLHQTDLYFGDEMVENIGMFRSKLDVYEEGVTKSFAGEITPEDTENPKYKDFLEAYLDLISRGNELTAKMYRSLKN